MSPRQLFNTITGLSMTEEGKSEFLNEVHSYCQQDKHLQSVTDRNHPADCQFRKAIEDQRATKAQ